MPTLDPPAPDRDGRRALDATATAFVVVAALSQLVFAAYVALFYGGHAVAGDLARWNEGMPNGHVAGDPVGNGMVAAHLALAVTMIVTGVVQLAPVVRRRRPAVHRWSGRVFALCASLLALGGLWLVWGRGSVGDLGQHLGITGNALAILACTAITVRHARARRIAAHRAWALRLWLVCGGVWFFRVALFLTITLAGGPVGFDPDRFTGPLLTAYTFAQWLVPLLVCEAYLRTSRAGPRAGRLAVATVLGAAALAVVAGTGVLYVARWGPLLMS